VSTTATNPPLPLVPEDTNTNFPSDPVIGNDDATPFDETNNPYANAGKLTSVDPPARTQRLLGGHIGDTYRSQLWFQEFARLEIEGVWHVISDPLLWRVDFRMIKRQVTEAMWNRDYNGDGDVNDNVTEALAGGDLNGDMDNNDLVGFWDDNGSVAANDNFGAL